MIDAGVAELGLSTSEALAALARQITSVAQFESIVTQATPSRRGQIRHLLLPLLPRSVRLELEAQACAKALQ